MFKKILIGIILLGIVVICLLQIDDDLNPEIAVLLEQAKPAESNDAYLYLLGIVAAEDEEPLTVGKQLFSTVQHVEEHYGFGDEPYGYEGYPEDKKLPLPHGELFCSSHEEACWKTIFSNVESLEETLQVNATLLSRYQTFITLSGYQTITQATMQEVLPPFEYLTKANRLIILNAVHQDRNTEILIENISALRRFLASADTLISKLIFTAMISENLDALSLMIHLNGNGLGANIPPLSREERELSTALSREFAMNYDIFKSLENSPEMFARADQQFSKNIPAWTVKTIYKLNMSLNGAAAFFKKLIVRSEREQVEFASPTVEEDKSLQLKLAYLRNPVGSILNDISSPNFDQYIARVFDLNAKIAILNQTSHNTVLPADVSFIQNPYYEKGGTAFYSENGKCICLTGPLEDGKNQRCLRVGF